MYALFLNFFYRNWQEYVVVNGVIASPFGSNHFAANLYYNIHRFLHTVGLSRILHSNEMASANEVRNHHTWHAQYGALFLST